MAKQPTLTRDQSLSARPLATTILHREPLPDGGQRVTVPFQPTGVQRWLLRVPDTATKKFELDPLGLEVLGHCTGKKSVRYIIDRFAKDHRVSNHEAEQAVVKFLQTMIRKGLVVIVVE